MAWDAGGGLWWAATAEIFKKYALLHTFENTFLTPDLADLRLLSCFRRPHFVVL